MNTSKQAKSRAWGPLSALLQPRSLETMPQTTAGPCRYEQDPPPQLESVVRFPDMPWRTGASCPARRAGSGCGPGGPLTVWSLRLSLWAGFPELASRQRSCVNDLRWMYVLFPQLFTRFQKFQVCFLFSSFEVIRSSLEPYLVVLLVSDRRGLCPPGWPLLGRGVHSKACVPRGRKPPRQRAPQGARRPGALPLSCFTRERRGPHQAHAFSAPVAAVFNHFVLALVLFPKYSS